MTTLSVAGRNIPRRTQPAANLLEYPGPKMAANHLLPEAS